jgi:hypothetical protein
MIVQYQNDAGATNDVTPRAFTVFCETIRRAYARSAAVALAM